MMYRDPLQAAKATYEQARNQLDGVDRLGDHADFGELPRRLRHELRDLEARSRPAEETVEAYVTAEKAATALADKLRVGRDLLAQLQFRQELGPVSRGRRLVRPLAFAALATAAYFAVGAAPGWMLRKVETAASDCIEESLGAGCDAHASSSWLWLPSIAPKTREPTKRLVESLPARALEARKAAILEKLRLAASALDDRPGRAAAIAQVLADARGEAPPVLARDLLAAGAFEAASQIPPTDANAAAVFDAALLEGRRDLATAAAVIAHAHEGWLRSEDREWEVRRGAWLCLVGRKEAGIAVLAAADLDAGSGSPTRRSGLEPARVAIVACGGGAAEAGFDPLRNERRANSLDALLASDPELHAGRRLAFLAAITPPSPDEGRPFRILRAGEPAVRAEELHRMALRELPTSPDLDRLASPWLLVEGRGPFFDPVRLDASAERLQAEAADAPARSPIDHRGADLPRAVLRAAWMARVEGAAEHVRHGRMEEALAAASRAEATGAGLTHSWATAAVRFAADDVAGAELVLEKFLASEEGTDFWRAWAMLQQVLALATLDKLPEAEGKAQRALASIGEMPLLVEESAPVLEGLRIVRAAVLLRQGRGDAAAAVFDGSETHPVGRWATFASRSKEARLSRKADLEGALTSLSEGSRLAVRAVLPAFLYLVGAAYRDVGNVELFLDRGTASELARRADLRRARAEAARWRGDEQAAKAWRERQRSILERPASAREAALGRIVGAW